MRDALKNVCRVLVAIVLGMVVCWLLGGCSPRIVTKEVPVTVHDSVRVVSVEQRVDTLWRYDTERIVDTMYIDTTTIATLGMPTLRHNRLAERTTDKGKASVKHTTDTLYIEREVPVPIKETVEVERKASLIERALMWAGGIGIAVTALLVAVRIKRSRFFS